MRDFAIALTGLVLAALIFLVTFLAYSTFVRDWSWGGFFVICTICWFVHLAFTIAKAIDNSLKP